MIYADNRCLQVKQQGGLILDPITNGYRKLLSTYAHEFNSKNNRSGALFRPKTKAICLTDEAEENESYITRQDYYYNLFNYIHDNPVKGGIVTRPRIGSGLPFVFTVAYAAVLFAIKNWRCRFVV